MLPMVLILVITVCYNHVPATAIGRQAWTDKPGLQGVKQADIGVWPQCCKSRRDPESRRQGHSRSAPTASPWQRGIWSPPAFPQGKKDSL